MSVLIIDEIINKENTNEVMPSTNMDGEINEVEEILDRRTRKGLLQYLVKWVGHGSDQNSWEPLDSFDPQTLTGSVADYERERKRKTEEKEKKNRMQKGKALKRKSREGLTIREKRGKKDEEEKKDVEEKKNEVEKNNEEKKEQECNEEGKKKEERNQEKKKEDEGEKKEEEGKKMEASSSGLETVQSVPFFPTAAQSQQSTPTYELISILQNPVYAPFLTNFLQKMLGVINTQPAHQPFNLPTPNYPIFQTPPPIFKQPPVFPHNFNPSYIPRPTPKKNQKGRKCLICQSQYHFKDNCPHNK